MVRQVKAIMLFKNTSKLTELQWIQRFEFHM
ncbi:hypothetical protein OIU74_013465 [Salix koriyanagi]|uniref:Uncharacterized protein n=1 Tax=Salix koriyanagi TaxID=2511006 RepID=A0A9Q0T6H6_9ROSI|nr:hypothetical protein OIU74_013465 [Salix koriyanagi]